MDVKEMSTEELQKALDEMYDEWDRSNTVFSLTDFEEVVIELESRCNQ